MTTRYFNVKQGIQTGNVVIDSASGNISNIGNITLVGGTSANLGNIVTANYFRGNGSLLTSITGANVTGYVPNANVANTASLATTAGTVTTNAQPNITSVGTLSSLTVTGLITATGTGIKTANVQDSTGTITITTGYGNIAGDVGVYGNLTAGTSGTGNVIASYFIGDGSQLTNISNANTANSATTAGTVTTNAQPNITSVGTLSSLTVTGNILAPAIVNNGTYNTQVALGANTGIIAIETNGNTTQFGPSGTISLSGASQINGGTFGGSGITLGTSQTDIFQNRSGNVTVQVGTGGTTTSTWTFENGGNLSAPGKITSSGLVSNSIVDFTTASNVSLGNISNLHIDGGAAGYVLQTNGSGVLTFASAGSTGIAGSNTQVQFNDAGSFGASNVFTFDKGTNTLSVTNFAGNGAGFTFITGSNVSGNVNSAIQSNYANTANSVAGANVTGQVGNALIAGTVYTAAQPNITSTGTLLGLSVTGNLNITGNINATGNLNYENVTDLVVGDPLIFIGANNTGNLFDLGFVASYDDGNGYHTGFARDATDGVWKLFDKVVAEPNTTIDFANATYPQFKSGAITSTGNITAVNANLGNAVVANYFIGDGSLLTNINGGNISNVGNANFANTAGTVTSNAQPNITSVGTLSSLSVTGNVSGSYFIGNGATLTYITGANVTGYVPLATAANTAGTVTSNAQPNITSVGTLANLTVTNTISGNITGNANYANTAGSATIAGTVTTNAQPNITSVGTLTSLSVTGNVSAGNIKSDNLLYANGSPYVFTTNAAGSNTQVQFNDSNSFAGSTAFTFNKGTNTLSATNFAGNGALLTNITGANVTGYVPLATAANTAGTVTSNAQPNITSVGTLSSLSVSGNLTAGNANVTGSLTVGSIATSGAGTGNISGADYIIANYFIGNGSLLTSITGANVTGYVPLATAANTAGTAYSVAGANVSGNVNSALQSNYANIANSVSGSNVTGQVGNALIAGTVYTNAQPNITSVGTLSNLSVTGTVTTGSVKLTTGLTSNRSNVSVTTNTVIDQFTPSTYRTAKYIISASGDHGYQSVETLMVHDGSNAFITIYGSVCSNVSADILDLSSNVNGVSGNVTLYATSASPNAKVNVVVTYITT